MNFNYAIRQSNLFLACYMLFLLIGLGLLLSYEKGEILLYINKNHTTGLNFFFKYATQIVEEYAIACMLLVLLFVRISYALIFTINALSVSLVIGILKQLVFSDAQRPIAFFDSSVSLNFVSGVELLTHHSFPSGHTALAFCVFVTLSLLVSKKGWSVCFFILALLVGISRIYLVQHFFMDVYIGSMVGLSLSIGIYYLLIRWHKFGQSSTLNTSILKKIYQLSKNSS